MHLVPPTQNVKYEERDWQLSRKFLTRVTVSFLFHCNSPIHHQLSFMFSPSSNSLSLCLFSRLESISTIERSKKKKRWTVFRSFLYFLQYKKENICIIETSTTYSKSKQKINDCKNEPNAIEFLIQNDEIRLFLTGRMFRKHNTTHFMLVLARISQFAFNRKCITPDTTCHWNVHWIHILFKSETTHN